MRPDRGGDAFAATDGAGVEQLPHIAGVLIRARRADGHAAVAAADQQYPIRLAFCRINDSPVIARAMFNAAAEPDRPGAGPHRATCSAHRRAMVGLTGAGGHIYGRVYDILWDTAGNPPGQRVLYPLAGVVSVSAYYGPNDDTQHAIVAVSDGSTTTSTGGEPKVVLTSSLRRRRVAAMKCYRHGTEPSARLSRHRVAGTPSAVATMAHRVRRRSSQDPQDYSGSGPDRYGPAREVTTARARRATTGPCPC